MSGTDESVVQLRGGLSTPLPVYTLLLDLERLGVTLTTDGSDLVVQPAANITDAHRAILRTQKPAILELLRYMARPDLDTHLFTDARSE